MAGIETRARRNGEDQPPQQTMRMGSALKNGFRMVRCDPALLLAELAWRWSLALTAAAALLYSLRDNQALLRINWDGTLLASGQTPAAIAELVDFAQQAFPLLLRMLSLTVPVLLIVWVGVATLGRGLITKRLLRQCGEEKILPAGWRSAQWVGVGALHAARVVILALVVAAHLLLLTATVAFVSVDPSRILLGGILLVAVFFPLLLAWSVFNWLLSLAVIFAVAEGQALADALAAAVAFGTRNYKECLSLAGGNAMLRSASALAFGLAGILLLLAAGLLPGWLLVAASAALTLAYCVVSDWLLLARWAGYVSLAASDRAAQPAGQRRASRVLGERAAAFFS